MKKSILLIAAAALLGFTACQSGILPPPEEDGIIRFTATLGDATNPSRAIIDGDTPKWEANDQIRIYCFSDTGNVYRVATRNYTAVSQKLASGGSSTATFELNVGPENQHWVEEAMFVIANFAGTSSSSNIAADKKTVSTDSDRAHIIYYTPGFNGSAWGNQDNNNVQVRVAYSYDRNLAFQNVFHLLRFTPNLSSGATKAIITRNTDGQPIARYQADVIFDSADGSILTVRPGGGNVDTLRRALVDGVNYFALDPGMTLTGGFKIELLNDLDETLQTFTYTGDFTTVRNKITTITNFDDRVVDAAGKAVLKNGQTFNVALKKLADGGDPYYYTNNTSITSIVVDTRSSVSTGTVVSADGSAVPIYANYDAGVITLSTPSNKIYFPASANRSFYCMKGIASLDMSKMILEDVTNASDMFRMCDALTSFGNIDLPNATNTTYMFSDCTSLETVGTLNLPLVNLTNNMFSGCSNLESIGNVDLPAATAVRSMFYNCQKMTEVGSVNIPLVTDANALFKECNALVTVGPVQMPAVENAGQMFSGCRELTSLTLNGVDNNTLTNLNDMFSSCAKLTTLDFTPVSDKVTTTASMFYDCESLTSVDISHISGNLTAVASMFRYCYVLDGIVFNSGFNTSGVTSFLSMFDNCRALTSLDLSMFDTSAAESMSQMFNNCRELTTIGATTRFITTASLTNTSSMFASCLKLASVDLTGLAGHPTSLQSMFSSCQSLTTIHLSNDFNTEAVSSYYSIFDYCTSLNQLYIKGFHLTKAKLTNPSSNLMNALRNVPSSCTIHYTTCNSSTEYDVRYYLPYSTTSGTGTGGFNWTTAN